MRTRFALIALLAFGASAWAGPEPLPPVQTYNKSGRDLLSRLSPLKKLLSTGKGGEGLLASSAGKSSDPSFRWDAVLGTSDLVQAKQAVPLQVEGGDPLQLLALLRTSAGTTIDATEFKVDLFESVTEGRIRARMRIRLVGRDAAGRVSIDGLLGTRWVREQGELKLEHLEMREALLVRGKGDAFTNEALKRGLLSIGSADSRFLPPSKELRYQVLRHAIGGASASDINGDGRDDVLLTQGDGLKLFLNVLEEGELRFKDVTEAWGLGQVAHPVVCLALDFDEDGDQDLFVGSFYGPNHLFENTGSSFKDVTAASGLEQDDMTAIACAADFDGDGRLDLYLGRFLDARTEIPQTMLYTRNGAPNRLYRGLGGLRFQDVSAASGADDTGLTLGAAAGDIDEDGDIDIYLSNDYGRNVFLRNQGDGTFKDEALESGTLAISGGMSASMGDLDGDGRLDLYVSSIRSNQRWFSEEQNVRSYVLKIVKSERRKGIQELFHDLRRHMGEDWPLVGRASLKGNYFLRQKEDGTFEDWSEKSGAAPAGWFWSSGFADLDNDGAQDVVAVNGWITGKLVDDL